MKPNLRAFSLVEVAMAIGIISFGLLAVVGLLPVGLKSVKNSNEQAAAAGVLQALADSARTVSATATNGSVVTYSGTFAGQNIVFSNQSRVFTWTNLTMEGTGDDANKRLAARLEIHPPANPAEPARGTVSVAWSAASPNLAWDDSLGTWKSADGSLTVGIRFLLEKP